MQDWPQTGTSCADARDDNYKSDGCFAAVHQQPTTTMVLAVIDYADADIWHAMVAYVYQDPDGTEKHVVTSSTTGW